MCSSILTLTWLAVSVSCLVGHLWLVVVIYAILQVISTVVYPYFRLCSTLNSSSQFCPNIVIVCYEWSHMHNNCETEMVYKAFPTPKALPIWKLALWCKPQGWCKCILTHFGTDIAWFWCHALWAVFIWDFIPLPAPEAGFQVHGFGVRWLSVIQFLVNYLAHTAMSLLIEFPKIALFVPCVCSPRRGLI